MLSPREYYQELSDLEPVLGLPSWTVAFSKPHFMYTRFNYYPKEYLVQFELDLLFPDDDYLNCYRLLNFPLDVFRHSYYLKDLGYEDSQEHHYFKFGRDEEGALTVKHRQTKKFYRKGNPDLILRCGESSSIVPHRWEYSFLEIGLERAIVIAAEILDGRKIRKTSSVVI